MRFVLSRFTMWHLPCPMGIASGCLVVSGIDSQKYAGDIVPKPPKPGFVSFGGIDVGVLWGFWYTHRRLQIIQSGPAPGQG